jgi:putative ABC transport system permease protein
MLVISKDQALSDLVLANLGYYTQDEFLNIIDRTSESESYNPALDRDFFSHEEMMGKTFYWYPNDAIYKATGDEKSPFTYDAYAKDITSEDAVELKVVGILQPKEAVQFGCLSAGIYYTEALTEHMLASNGSSEIVTYLNDSEKKEFSSSEMTFGPTTTRTGIFYPFTYTYDGVTYNEYGLVGSSFTMGTTKTATLSQRQLGGDSLANSFTIYPPSFDSMHNVTAYLDAWNGDGDVTLNGATVTADDREDVTYTDTLSIIITMLNTMIDIISYALIAFTSISLVVSTVMIGIITYVSVVERIKEIGVIRALGGRKKDVSRLFRAETFIIGLLAGLFGVGLTYGICWIASTIVESLTGVANIALLPLTDAVVLILLSILLTSLSGIMPASSAAKKDPVVALRTE